MLPGETLPDIDALRKEPGNTLDVVNWDVKVGDCLLHHSMTVHGAPGNASSTQLHPAPPRPRDAGPATMRCTHRAKGRHASRSTSRPAASASRSTARCFPACGRGDAAVQWRLPR